LLAVVEVFDGSYFGASVNALLSGFFFHQAKPDQLGMPIWQPAKPSDKNPTSATRPIEARMARSTYYVV
jgi:hypothetical protein